MALSEKLWSLNALSTELATDRRTLAKRLADLPPVEQKRYGNRLEKKWRLKDVVSHLNRPKRRQSKPFDEAAELERLENDPEFMAETLKMLQQFVGQEVFPKLTDSAPFVNIIVNGLNDEFGLSARDGLRAYQIVVLAMVYALCEGFSDDDMDFKMPEFAETLEKEGLDKVAADWKFPPPE